MTRMAEASGELLERIARLERRVGVLQDREDITNVIARYGPAVDSGSADETAELWSMEGTYSYPFEGQTFTLEGRGSVHSMVLGETHQQIIRGGAAHVLTAPAISLDGDRATAVGYSLLLRVNPVSGEFDVWRVSANRWELAREPAGWRVSGRENQLMDGNEAARALLRLGPIK